MSKEMSQKDVVELKNLLALFWKLAYYEGETGKSHESKAEDVVGAILALARPEPERWINLVCKDPMCACRGGPLAKCLEGDLEKDVAALRRSTLNYYKRRTDALQKAQKQMRDPERTMVCDILANGFLLTPSGDRYTTQQPKENRDL